MSDKHTSIMVEYVLDGRGRLRRKLRLNVACNRQNRRRRIQSAAFDGKIKALHDELGGVFGQRDLLTHLAAPPCSGWQATLGSQESRPRRLGMRRQVRAPRSS